MPANLSKSSTVYTVCFNLHFKGRLTGYRWEYSDYVNEISGVSIYLWKSLLALGMAPAVTSTTPLQNW